jgi:hypothetical protein
MSKRKKTTRERGLFKKEIHQALYKSTDIREMLLGDTSGMKPAEIMSEFKKHVKSHLFIDETVMDAQMFIYYDIVMPSLRSNIKECKVIFYIICHRDFVDYDCAKDGYFGNRVDILTEMVEDALLDEEVVNNFGIGELTLDSISVYNATRFYGCIMEYIVPNFR